MNYFNLYEAIITSQKARDLDEYCEIHHIVPRCLGGSDESHNLVRVSSKAHFILHWLLIKMHPNNKKLIYAFRMMCVHGNGQSRYTSASYKYSREKYIEHHPMKSTELRKKISSSLKQHFSNKMMEHGTLARMCIVSFCLTCGKVIKNKDVIYCSKVCIASSPNKENTSKILSKAISKYCQSKEGRAQRSKTSTLVYASKTDEEKAARAEKIKNSKAAAAEELKQLTDEEFYGIINKLNPFCKDGKRRNGNVVYRLKLRGIDVDRYYDELGRASS